MNTTIILIQFAIGSLFFGTLWLLADFGRRMKLEGHLQKKRASLVLIEQELLLAQKLAVEHYHSTTPEITDALLSAKADLRKLHITISAIEEDICSLGVDAKTASSLVFEFITNQKTSKDMESIAQRISFVQHEILSATSAWKDLLLGQSSHA